MHFIALLHTQTAPTLSLFYSGKSHFSSLGNLILPLSAGLVQEPPRQVEEAGATPDERQRGLQQGRLRPAVQRADAAVPRGLPGQLRLPHLQQLGSQGAQPQPR